MKKIVYILIGIVMVSCEYNDLLPSVKSYTPIWSKDLSLSSPLPQNFTNYYVRDQVQKLTDGSIIILRYAGSPSNTSEIRRITLSKLNSKGTVIKELKLQSYYLATVAPTIDGGVVLMRGDSLSLYDQDLNNLSNSSLEIEPVFHEILALKNSGAFISKYENNALSLVRYDLKGKPIWKTSFAELGCGGNYVSLTYNSVDDFLGLISVADTVKVSYVKAETGQLSWNKTFLRTDFGTLNNPAWFSNAELKFAGTVNDGSDLQLTTLNQSLRSGILKAGLPKGCYVQKSIATKDHGMLLAAINSNDPTSYILIKLNLVNEIMWQGTYDIESIDFFSDMIELGDGSVITVTVSGKVQAFRPSY